MEQREIQIGLASIQVVAESRWKIEQMECELARVSQEIQTATERWRIAFTVSTDGENNPLGRLFAPGVDAPFIVKIFGLYGEESKPAATAYLNDNSVSNSGVWVRLNTGDEFLAPESTVELLQNISQMPLAKGELKSAIQEAVAVHSEIVGGIVGELKTAIVESSETVAGGLAKIEQATQSKLPPPPKPRSTANLIPREPKYDAEDDEKYWKLWMGREYGCNTVKKFLNENEIPKKFDADGFRLLIGRVRKKHKKAFSKAKRK